jgi:hypothetical protein
VNDDSSRLRSRLDTSHRHLGLVTAVIVLFLAVTGLALNHADRLAFLQHTLRSEALLRWYGLSPAEAPLGFRMQERWAVDLDRRIYLDGQHLGSSDSVLLGAVELPDLFVLATREEILLATTGEPPELVERLGRAALPGPIERVGKTPSGELRVSTPDGIYSADADLVTWRRIEVSPGKESWSASSPLPDELRTTVLREFRGEGLPLSRVLADLHSGRIFGRYGFVLMDAAAILLVLLTVTGIYNWLRRPRRPAS